MCIQEETEKNTSLRNGKVVRIHNQFFLSGFTARLHCSTQCLGILNVENDLRNYLYASYNIGDWEDSTAMIIAEHMSWTGSLFMSRGLPIENSCFFLN